MSTPVADQADEVIPLSLHAEFLPNIRQVSLQISVPIDANPEISLSESRRAVSVSVSLPGPVGYVSETIKLPACVREASRRVLDVAHTRRNVNLSTENSGAGVGSDKLQELSYRLQVDDSADELTRNSAMEDHMESFVPWSAADMSPSTKLRCRQCRTMFLDKPAAVTSLSQSEGKTVPHSAAWVWKDLPSGNWAEMMDFWHCHKPDPHEDEYNADGAPKQLVEDENSKVKGYGASNQVLASPGTVLVDVATFLVADTDCTGLKKILKECTSGSLLPSEEELRCKECDMLIGVEDTIAKGWRLFKTSISAEVPSPKEGTTEADWESHPTELVVAAQLLELIERESARRFIIHCGRKDGLLIWVFNPDLRYSNSSSEHSITSQRAMKIFFQTTANVEKMLHPEPGKTSSLSLEELKLPSSTFDSLANGLDASNSMLPRSARTFQGEWRVGILHRFEKLKRT